MGFPGLLCLYVSLLDCIVKKYIQFATHVRLNSWLWPASVVLFFNLVVVPCLAGVLILVGLFSEWVGFIVCLYVFLFSVGVWVGFSSYVGSYQFVEVFHWGKFSCISFGVDGVSLFFVVLTTTMFVLCYVYALYGGITGSRYLLSLLFLLEGLILGVFLVIDLLGFYVLFELVLVPVYVLIGYWGQRGRRIRAGYMFFIYTFLGSLFMLISIILLYCNIGTTSMFVFSFDDYTFYMYYVWIGVFIGFMVKVPVIPFHLWLAEAHVEAPTLGSVLLASLLLKLGTYGMVRVLIGYFSILSEYYGTVLVILFLLSIVYGSLMSICQVDMKKVIAYSSIAHMNVTLLGVFSLTVEGMGGGLLLMFGHGVVSGGLFFCIGFLYSRFATRIIRYYSGIVYSMPLYSLFFLLFCLGNLGLPLTVNFVGEFMSLLGMYMLNKFVSLIGSFTVVLSGVYMLWLYNRLLYGNFGLSRATYPIYWDLTSVEFSLLFSLSLITILLGVFPNVFLGFVQSSVLFILL